MNVLLVDDHPMIREAMRATLQVLDPEFSVVGEAGTAREAVDLAEALRPDLIVMDILLPGSNGVEATRDVRRRGLDCKIIVYSAIDMPSLLEEVFAAGADGYVLKSASIEELKNAVTVVGNGQRYVSMAIASRLDHGTERGASGMKALSARERQIFDLVVRGNTNTQISASLFISVKTVETHRSRINRKLAVHSTAELIRFAALSGILYE